MTNYQYVKSYTSRKTLLLGAVDALIGMFLVVAFLVLAIGFISLFA